LRSGNNRAGGFTLIEMIVVIGILGILIAMIIGALGSVQGYMNSKNTQELFAGLTAALDAYHSDFNYYPWHDQNKNPMYPLMGTVARDLNPLIQDQIAFAADGEKAMLFAVITTSQRKALGGYFTPTAGQTVTRKTQTGLSYQVFIDGWGRPILYAPPDLAARRTRMPNGVTYDPGLQKLTQGTFWYSGPPVLESLGSDEFDDRDNIVNYGTINSN
jgi:prepilin-type N-terminal cleavage/methylation domain-containing protein